MKRHSILYGRIAYSLIIALVYLIGRSIPIPWDASGSAQSAAGLSALFGGILGGRADLTLFSLGLTPWVVSVIVVQALNPLIRNCPGDEMSVRGWLTSFLTLLLSVVLALMQVRETELLSAQGLPGSVQRTAAVILLTAGSFCIVWLSRRNEDWGIGGQRLFIVINLIDMLLSSVSILRKEHALSLMENGGSGSVMILVLLLLVVIAVTVFFQKKEYRYPVHRLMIDSRYVGEDYLAIRYNPAGTMPVVYVMALFSALSSFVSAYAGILPTGISDALLMVLNLSSIAGAMLFLILFRALTELAAIFTIDPVKTADDLKRSGGYIEGVYPGKASEAFLRKKIRQASNLSSAAMGLLLVLPYAYGLLYAGTEKIGEIAVSVVFLTGILIELLEECAMYYSMQDYRPILGVEYQKGSGRNMEREAAPEAKCRDANERGADCAEPAGKGEEVSSEPASPGPVKAVKQQSGKYYFVPAWDEDRSLFDQGDIIAPSVPVYDDIVHQMRMFHSAGEQAQLLGLTYLPQLRHFLHRCRLEDVPFLSFFDELQGIRLTRPGVLHWQDLEWGRLGRKEETCDLIWIPVNGVMCGYQEDRRIFDIHFTQDGVVYYVDHYDEESQALLLDRRSIYDDRGFLSSSIEFMNPDRKGENESCAVVPEDSETSTTKIHQIPGSPKADAVQRFYNEDGEEQFHITFPDGRVKFNQENPVGPAANGAEWGSVSQMIDSQTDRFLEKCQKGSAFFLAAQGEADETVCRAERYAGEDRKVILSFLEGRYAQLKGAEKEGSKADSPICNDRSDGKEGSAKAPFPANDREGETIRQYKRAASMIVVDTEEKREYFERFEYVDPSEDRRKRRRVPVEDIYPREMRSRTGQSERTSQVVIFMSADGMFEEDIPGRDSLIVRHIEFLMKEDANIWLWLGTERGKEHLPEFDRKCKEWLEKYREYKSENAGNLLYVEKGWDKSSNPPSNPEEQDVREKARAEARARKNNELKAMHRRVRVVSCQTEEEMDTILEATRVVLDPRTSPDLRLQTAALCYGIPQVVCAPSRYVIHTENGYVCSDVQYIVDGLRYYIDRLYNWNRAHEFCAHMIRQYTGEALTQQVQQWKRLIEGEETGQ